MCGLHVVASPLIGFFSACQCTKFPISNLFSWVDCITCLLLKYNGLMQKFVFHWIVKFNKTMQSKEDIVSYVWSCIKVSTGWTQRLDWSKRILRWKANHGKETTRVRVERLFHQVWTKAVINNMVVERMKYENRWVNAWMYQWLNDWMTRN